MDFHQVKQIFYYKHIYKEAEKWKNRTNDLQVHASTTTKILLLTKLGNEQQTCKYVHLQEIIQAFLA